MRWLLLIVVVVLLVGPLRPWVGRHWAFLISMVAGAVFGWVLGAVVIGRRGGPAFLPLVSAVICAIALGRSGPAWVRKIERDGKDDSFSRRH